MRGFVGRLVWAGLASRIGPSLVQGRPGPRAIGYRAAELREPRSHRLEELF